MAVTALNTIKNWFKTGLKPTQTQFWATWDSFWHKDEQIPQSSIQNLVSVLNAKAEKIQFDAHTTDPNAHNTLFNLKQSLSEKGEAKGYAPLDEFTKIAAEYLYIVNDLITGGTDAVLSAEQGKALQVQIDGINTILSSNDVNLDTVQEIVDAIKDFENTIDNILVNDLVTGGTTKALTAQQGVVLKGLIDALQTALTDYQAAQVTALALKQDIANQVEVSTSQDAQASWHGKTVLFTANVTIVIPASGLPDGYTFEGITMPSCAVTWGISSPKVWSFGTPPVTSEKQIFTLLQQNSNSNNILFLGL